MTFLEAVYGSQYCEIHQKGKDGNKGRLNGNIFLSAMILLFAMAILVLCISFVPGLNESIARLLRSVFGHSSGKFYAISRCNKKEGQCEDSSPLFCFTRNRFWPGNNEMIKSGVPDHAHKLIKQIP
jgi:hypothetical protein